MINYRASFFQTFFGCLFPYSKFSRTCIPSPAPGASPSMEPWDLRGSSGIKGSFRTAANPISYAWKPAGQLCRSKPSSPAQITLPGDRPRVPPHRAASSLYTPLDGCLQTKCMGRRNLNTDTILSGITGKTPPPPRLRTVVPFFMLVGSESTHFASRVRSRWLGLDELLNGLLLLGQTQISLCNPSR